MPAHRKRWQHQNDQPIVREDRFQFRQAPKSEDRAQPVVELEAERAFPASVASNIFRPPSVDGRLFLLLGFRRRHLCRSQGPLLRPLCSSTVAPELSSGSGKRGAARLEVGLATALAVGWGVLEHGGGALPASVEAVASLEDSGLFNAGRGSAPNSEGLIETDASVMDGSTKAAGAVGAASWPANPVRAALAVGSPASTRAPVALSLVVLRTWAAHARAIGPGWW